MNTITKGDLRPGLVVLIDTSLMTDVKGVENNTTEDKAVAGRHYFLLLQEIDRDRWLAAPMYSEHRPSRVELDSSGRGGDPTWINADPSYIDKFQHWKMPSEAILVAEVDDFEGAGHIRYYNETDSLSFSKLADLVEANRNAFRRWPSEKK